MAEFYFCLSHIGAQEELVEKICADLELENRYPFFDRASGSLTDDVGRSRIKLQQQKETLEVLGIFHHRDLALLHSQEVILRDLKPPNVLCQAHADAIHAEIGSILDFGISPSNFWRPVRKGGRSLKIQNVEKCDVYSYGMLCYEVLTSARKSQNCPKTSVTGSAGFVHNLKFGKVLKVGLTDVVEQMLEGGLTNPKMEQIDTESEDEGLSYDSSATHESQTEVTTDSHTNQSYPPCHETNSKYTGRKRSFSTVEEDDLITLITPLVKQQVEDVLKSTLLPLVSILRRQGEEEQTYREKLVALEEKQLALKREKLLIKKQCVGGFQPTQGASSAMASGQRTLQGLRSSEAAPIPSL